jgi:hypothetical protein
MAHAAAPAAVSDAHVAALSSRLSGHADVRLPASLLRQARALACACIRDLACAGWRTAPQVP